MGSRSGRLQVALLRKTLPQSDASLSCHQQASARWLMPPPSTPGIEGMHSAKRWLMPPHKFAHGPSTAPCATTQLRLSLVALSPLRSTLGRALRQILHGLPRHSPQGNNVQEEQHSVPLLPGPHRHNAELLLGTMTIQQTRVLQCLPQVRGCYEVDLWSTTRTAATPKTRLAPNGQPDGCSGRVTLNLIATHQPPKPSAQISARITKCSCF